MTTSGLTMPSLTRLWFAAHQQRQQRWLRSAQLLKYHAACLRVESVAAEFPDLRTCDGVVAGLILLVTKPCLDALRERLVQAAATHPFGLLDSNFKAESRCNCGSLQEAWIVSGHPFFTEAHHTCA
jgi:hypothetical protein